MSLRRADVFFRVIDSHTQIERFTLILVWVAGDFVLLLLSSLSEADLIFPFDRAQQQKSCRFVSECNKVNLFVSVECELEFVKNCGEFWRYQVINQNCARFESDAINFRR